MWNFNGKRLQDYTDYGASIETCDDRLLKAKEALVIFWLLLTHVGKFVLHVLDNRISSEEKYTAVNMVSKMLGEPNIVVKILHMMRLLQM